MAKRGTPARTKLNGSKTPQSMASAPPAVGPGAIALFERAMHALQLHRYHEAGTLFEDLIVRFPAERMLGDRARVYAALCAREAAKAATARDPATFEERMTAATAALNNGDNEEAYRLATLALRERPDYDLALYIAAVVYVRRGDFDTALDRLAHAVTVSPDVRAQARHDADFEPLRREKAFQQLVEDPPRLSQSGTRR